MIVSELIEQLRAMGPRDEVIVQGQDGFVPVSDVTLQRWEEQRNAPEVYEPHVTANEKGDFLVDVVVLWPEDSE